MMITEGRNGKMKLVDPEGITSMMQEIRRKLDVLEGRLAAVEKRGARGKGGADDLGEGEGEGSDRKMRQTISPFEGLQEEDSFLTYAEAFAALANQVELSEEEMVARFMEGLRRDIRVLSPKTLQRAVAIKKVLTSGDDPYRNKGFMEKKVMVSEEFVRFNDVENDVALSDSDEGRNVDAGDNSQLEEMDPPCMLLGEPHPYQRQALGWMVQLGKGCFMDEAATTLHPCWEAYRLTDRGNVITYLNTFSGETLFSLNASSDTDMDVKDQTIKWKVEPIKLKSKKIGQRPWNDGRCSKIFGESELRMMQGDTPTSVVGWGVGGIEAEVAMLGQPRSMVLPGVIGFKLSGRLCHVTLQYLKLTGRSDETVAMIEAYLRANKMFIVYNEHQQERVYSSYLELNLSESGPCMSGPKRLHDGALLKDMKADCYSCLNNEVGFKGFAVPKEVQDNVARFSFHGHPAELSHGSVVRAAITSCTNMSKTSVMPGAVSRN